MTMQVTAIYPVMMSTDPVATADFYRALLGLETTFAGGWYESLRAPSGPELAAVARDHETVPDAFRAPPAGVIVTVEVDDARAARARVTALGAPVERELIDEPFGQRHFMTRDPDGLLVDVVQPIAPSPEYAARYDPSALPSGG